LSIQFEAILQTLDPWF